MKELGVSGRVADRIIEKVPPVRIDGVRKLYVRREDVARLMANG